MLGIGDKIRDVISDIFIWFYESLIEPFLFLHSFGNLIYGTGRTEDLIHNTFTSTEITEIYQPGSALVATIAGFVIVSAIVIAGMRIGSTTINPANRTYYLEFLKDLGIVLIIFFNLSFLYDLVFQANSGIVGVFGASQDHESGILETVEGTGIIGSIFVGIIILFLMLWANWYYMMRKLTLLILMIIGPLMIALYLIPQFKAITAAWFKEFVGTVFVQSIHAILYWMITLIVAGQSADTDNPIESLFNLETVILYLIFIPIGESIRSLLGMGGGMTSGMSKVGSMFGMSALAGVYGSVKGALDKDNGSVMNSLKQAKDGVSNANKSSSVDEESTIRDATIAANTGTNTGTTPKADSMLKWGDIGSRAGKAVLGSAGSIGGTAIGGPMGSMVGSTIGFAAGGVAGGIAGRGTKATADFATDRLKSAFNEGTATWKDKSDPLNANTEDLANTLANKATADYENENKTSFMESAQENFPDLDEKGLEQQWEEHKSGIHQGNLSQARNLVRKASSKDGKLANASTLANVSAQEMTNQWASDNKASFVEGYDKANPLPENASKAQIDAHNQNRENAWDQKLDSQSNLYQDVANKTAAQLKSNSMGSQMISKDQFGKSFANNMQQHDKDGFVSEYQKQNPNATVDEANKAFATAKGDKGSFISSYQSSNPTATQAQAESLYNKANTAFSGDEGSYVSSVNSAMNNVKPEAIFNKGANNEVNRGYLNNQLASAQTAIDKSNFINGKVAEGVMESDASAMWETQEKQVFNDNLSHFDKQLPQVINMKQAVSKSSGLQNIKAGAMATSAFVGEATGITPVSKAVKNASLKTQMVTKSFKDGYTEGANVITQAPGNANSTSMGQNLITSTKAIGSGISQGLESAKGAAQPFTEDAIEKQKSFQSAVAYTGGLIGGAKLYQKAGNLASRVSPYNTAINNSSASGSYETSEIRQMASRKDEETGQSYIPQGNIQLITTPKNSYVQAIDSAGQKRIVSRYGAGDSALTEGQTIYQDLTVDDRGGLKTTSQSYQMDTGGNKVETGRRININPNKLIATNRPESVNPMVLQNVTPYNASVETGAFSKNDALMNVDNIRTVVTKERSYMVGQDKSSGKEVRISPYKSGDARLDVNEIREVEYVVENKRFNIAQTTNNHGKQIDYKPPFDTSEYLHTPRNPRSQRRSQFESQRYKNIGGGE